MFLKEVIAQMDVGRTAADGEVLPQTAAREEVLPQTDAGRTAADQEGLAYKSPGQSAAGLDQVASFSP